MVEASEKRVEPPVVELKQPTQETPPAKSEQSRVNHSRRPCL
jgi:hypothetical protein